MSKKHVVDDDVRAGEVLVCAVDESEGIEIYPTYFDRDAGPIHRYRSSILAFNFAVIGESVGTEAWLETIADIRKVVLLRPLSPEEARKQIEYAVRRAAEALTHWPYVHKIGAAKISPYVWEQIRRFR
jgi:hypothetical protein